MTDRRTFATGQRVIFRESEEGHPESGTVCFEFEPTPEHPNGGEYGVDLDDDTSVTAHWTELTSE